MRNYLIIGLVVSLSCFLLQSCRPQETTTTNVIVQRPTGYQQALVNKAIGHLFMTKNKLTSGVVVMPSGLQYKVIRLGSGGTPKKTDTVVLYYRGQYIDGTVFDNKHFQKNPVTVRVSDVIPGIQEALMLMPQGSIWILYLPPQLAFGAKGFPGKIEPEQTVVYRVYLHHLVK